jgi:hypothetical protein
MSTAAVGTVRFMSTPVISDGGIFLGLRIVKRGKDYFAGGVGCESGPP